MSGPREPCALYPQLTSPGPPKTRRTCGLFPARTCPPFPPGRPLVLTQPAGDSALQTIPLYNVLWAEATADALSVTYADPRRQLRPATLTFCLSDPGSADPFASALLRAAYGPATPRRRAKVLVNPHAGPGGADRLWEHEVAPIFRAARMSVDVVRTRYSGEGVDIARDLDADAYDVIVACSGDGLPHEIFNGLGRRPDARRALARLAVAHVPCGSGNAMSCNLYGTHRAAPAALAIVKGVVTSMDLMSVTQGGERYLSFLSQSLGVVAESDLATEHMRWMGEARFTVGFLQRIFKGKVYPCEVAMKVEVEGKENIREHYRRERAGDGTDAVVEGKGEPGSAGSSVDDGDGLPPLKYGTVGDKIPEGWEVVSYDKLGNFYCGNVSSPRCCLSLSIPTSTALIETPRTLTRGEQRCATLPRRQTFSRPRCPATASSIC